MLEFLQTGKALSVLAAIGMIGFVSKLITRSLYKRLLNPHHGMCLAYFKGEGYSNGFSAHMQEMLDIFQKGAKIQLHADTDEICSACPNNEKGCCSSFSLVEAYDNAVLELCGLENGQIMEFDDFTDIVQKKILASGKRKEICGNCQWNSICESQKSRWEKC